jgi:hypothetical protein
VQARIRQPVGLGEFAEDADRVGHGKTPGWGAVFGQGSLKGDCGPVSGKSIAATPDMVGRQSWERDAPVFSGTRRGDLPACARSLADEASRAGQLGGPLGLVAEGEVQLLVAEFGDPEQQGGDVAAQFEIPAARSGREIASQATLQTARLERDSAKGVDHASVATVYYRFMYVMGDVWSKRDRWRSAVHCANEGRST